MIALLTPITLLADETIVFRTKKHWILFFLPALLLAVAVFFTTSNTITNTITQGFNILLERTSYLDWASKIPLLFLLLAFAVTTLNSWLVYATSDFVITNKRVIMRQGFFDRYVREMRLSTVSLVSVDQDFLGQLIDYGTIRIQSFGASDYFQKISHPKQFQFYLQQEIDKASH